MKEDMAFLFVGRKAEVYGNPGACGGLSIDCNFAAARSTVAARDFAAIVVDCDAAPNIEAITALVCNIREESRSALTPLLLLISADVLGEGITPPAYLELLELHAVELMAKLVVPELLKSKLQSFAERDRLQKSVSELEGRVEQKTKFISALAHELRTPLTPLRNAVHLLRVTKDEATSEKACSIAERQIRHLGRIVEDILELSRMERGDVDVRLERIDLVEIARQSVAEARPTFETLKIELAVTLPTSPIAVLGNESRLRRMFANLLANASKFTDRGGRVILKMDATEAGAHLTVRDTGAGLAPESIPKVFEPFSSDETASGTGRGGLELGLALVKGFVQLLGGAVSASSEGIGRGTEIAIFLPRTEDAAAPHVGGPLERAAHRKPLKVLVVEDNRDTAESLRLLLELCKCKVSVAFNGPDGIELARTERPELVLCDIGLPGFDGYEVARRLRAQTFGEDALLVALTGYGEEADKRLAYEAGFDRHYTKPIDPVVLEELLMVGK